MLSEAGIYEMLIKRFGQMNSRNLIGIGDDCAVIPGDQNKNILVSKDLLVSGIHFEVSWNRFRELGFKSLAVNVSDVAAMGGRPLYVLLGLSISSEIQSGQLEEFLDGFNEATRTYNVQVIGGDTTGSPSGFFVSVTVIGEVANDFLKLRSNAKSGDIIAINAPNIGDAAAGLQCLIRNNVNEYPTLCDAQLKPMINIEHGRWLGEQSSVHAMMDLSDGIAQDLPRLCKASGCGAEVYVDQIPRSHAFEQFVSSNETREKSKINFLLNGGEDYCLLMTISERDFLDVKNRFNEKFDRQLFPIGRITDKTQRIEFFEDGSLLEPPFDGFRHF